MKRSRHAEFVKFFTVCFSFLNKGKMRRRRIEEEEGNTENGRKPDALFIALPKSAIRPIFLCPRFLAFIFIYSHFTFFRDVLLLLFLHQLLRLPVLPSYLLLPPPPPVVHPAFHFSFLWFSVSLPNASHCRRCRRRRLLSFFLSFFLSFLPSSILRAFLTDDAVPAAQSQRCQSGPAAGAGQRRFGRCGADRLWLWPRVAVPAG